MDRSGNIGRLDSGRIDGSISTSHSNGSCPPSSLKSNVILSVLKSPSVAIGKQKASSSHVSITDAGENEFQTGSVSVDTDDAFETRLEKGRLQGKTDVSYVLMNAKERTDSQRRVLTAPQWVDGKVEQKATKHEQLSSVSSAF